MGYVWLLLGFFVLSQAACAKVDDVKMQLHWVMQAQFVHFVAAVEKGFFRDECLSVSVLAGGPGLDSIEWIQKGVTQFGTSWLAPVLAASEAGIDHVIIAQQFQKSGTLLVTLASSGIDEFKKLKGKKVATWKYLDAEVLAALRKFGVDYTHVDLTFGPQGLTTGSADAVMAMTYNEYAQLLETVNPATGNLWRDEDFNRFDFNALGTSVLQDSLIVSRNYLLENEDIVKRFLRAAMKGFAFCREDPVTCVSYLYSDGIITRQDHQRWQMNEINKLIWIQGQPWGSLNQTKFQTTLDITRQSGAITLPDSAFQNVYNLTLLEEARTELVAEGYTEFRGTVNSNPSVLKWCTLGEDNACGNTATAYICTGRERGREESYNGYNTPTGIAFLAVASLAIILTLLTFLCLIIYWDHPTITTATPQFLAIMLVGICCGFVSIYFWLGRPTTALCVLRYTFPTLSFTLVMSPLLAKTWRLWYIFREAKQLKPTKIRIVELIPIIVVSFLIQMVITIVWMCVATPETAMENPLGDLYTTYVTCDWPNEEGTTDITVIFYGLTIAYNGLLLFIGVVLGYKVRKLPSHFNESKAIILSMYNLGLISLIILILAFTLNDPTTVGLFLMLGFLLGSLGCLFCLFAPKFWIIWFRPDKSTTSSQKSSSTASKTKSKLTASEA